MAEDVRMDDRDLGFGDLSALGPMEEWPIGRLFTAAARLSQPAVWRQVERHGVSPAGFFLLRALAGEDSLRAGELARRLLITPATVTSVVGTLERNGHVERRRDPGDRRAVVVQITDSGLAVVKTTSASMEDDFWAAFDVVDEADVPAVRRFLLRLIERFGADDFQDGGRPRHECAAGGTGCGP
jgi:DNA-binding MarR family transcriptional regulator